MIEERIEEALKPLGYPVKLGCYAGSEECYFVYIYEAETDTEYEDNEPTITRNYMQVHFFLPKRKYKETIKKNIKTMLSKAGMTVTDTRVLMEKDTGVSHIIYSITADETIERGN